MLQYLLYFVVGGGIVATVAFLAQKGNAALAVLVANIPIMFLLNMLLTYKAAGVTGSLTYANSALMYLPVYIIFVIITIWVLPRLGMPKALLPGVPVFILPLMIKRIRAYKINKMAKNTFMQNADIAGSMFGKQREIKQGLSRN
jgi:hypothetical protein